MDRQRDRRSRPDPGLNGPGPILRTTQALSTPRLLSAPKASRARRAFRSPRALRATRPGWCFVAIVFGVGFAALNTGNNLLYLVLALMLAFLVLSGLLSEASLRGIRVERRLPRELFANAKGRVILRIHNDLRRVPSFAISVDDEIATPEGQDLAGRTFALRVGPGEQIDRSYLMTPRARGDLHFQSLRVSTRFPFGLFVKSMVIDQPAETLVYPRIGPIGKRIDGGHDHEGAPLGGSIRRGEDVTGLREFVRGDSPGQVHWRRSLRAGRLFVGEREGEAAGEIEILFPVSESSPGIPPERLEEQISQTASEIVTHLDAGLRVGLRTPDLRFAPATGESHRGALLTFLARFGSGRAPNASATREDLGQPRDSKSMQETSAEHTTPSPSLDRQAP